MTPPQISPTYGLTRSDERSPTAAAGVGTLRVGCAMWAHRAWPGRHLPHRDTSVSELTAYATWCRAVEGNTTFYATPAATTIERWRADTPDDFRFCFKLPRTITHERRLRHTSDLVDDFARRIEPVGDRLGPVQIQLPPSFAGGDLEALEGFLRQLPTIDGSAGWAVELRHPDYFVGGRHERSVDDVLMELDVNRVILDSRALFDRPAVSDEEIDAWKKKPRLPVRPVATARDPIVRLIGSSDLDACLDRWHQWVPSVVRWLADGRSPSIFTHTPDNVDAPPLARRLHERIADACEASGQPRPVLPEPLLADEQLDLLTADRDRRR